MYLLLFHHNICMMNVKFSSIWMRVYVYYHHTQIRKAIGGKKYKLVKGKYES